jgi:hypothetical protein
VSDLDVFGAAGGSARDRGRNAAGSVFGNDYARYADGARGAQNRADVLRIFKMIENDYRRVLVGLNRRENFLETDIRIARRFQRDALVVPEARKFIELIALHRADH